MLVLRFLRKNNSALSKKPTFPVKFNDFQAAKEISSNLPQI